MSHYKPYPAYKDSGVEWLGRVPEHWTIGPYKATIQIENGADYKEVEADDGYPVIGSGGPFAFSSKLMYDGESVLLGRKGTIDKPLYVNGAFWAVDTMYWSIIKPGAHGRFAYYIATTIPFDMYSTNTALPSMTKSVLGSHVVAFPGFEEQEAIADHLDRETARIDSLIEKKTRFIELLREKRQVLITHVVTKGLDPNVKMKDSGVEWLGEVPEHWEVRSVSSVSTKITNGYVGPTRDILVEEGVRYLQSLHIKGNQIKFDVPYFVTEEWSNQHRKSILETGDVLIVQTGDIGQVTVVTDEFAGCNCHALIIVAPERSIIAGEWMSWVFNSSYGYHTLLSIQTGAMHPHLNCGNVKDVFLPVPPLTEQREIMKHIEHEERRVAALVGKTERSIELLKERRSALITAAVTGLIDLREAV
ncbi:restriction endonuclease subunit S [Pseudomonas paraeruginosa]|uniref:restriction endonuclease subunit S n=1 Tax=Pseudomonas paraeruginosa TaxID=2994495 RepID=UPI003D2DEBF9